ncbi:MAG: isopentenyl-diphosphate Delta-isomerase [Syntrophorhabdaceae bacterium]|nr:isopentenyl-diphosphate Delta-isomerase [Syntrophorhabdaceae bacterium]
METLILVDSDDNPTGYEEKETCHLIPTKLHRAFSIFIVNSKMEMLIHRRSGLKKTWPRLWTNACCSHPRKDEMMESAVERRLFEELGIFCQPKYLFRFQYKIDYSDSYGENEVDHVFLGLYDGPINPDIDEIEEWRFIGINELLEDIKKNGEEYTPWFKIALPRVIEHLLSSNFKT